MSSNPWTKRNPVMSVWLSGLHRSINAARGQRAAQSKRQAAMLMNKGYDDLLRLWSGSWMLEPAPARKRRPR